MIGKSVNAKKARKYGNMNKLEVSFDFQLDVVDNEFPPILRIEDG